MKFTEFKQSQEVQLTEEQEVIISYCEGSITKKDAVSQLLEFDWRDVANKVTWGAVDSRAEQDAQDKAGYSLSDTFAMPGKAAQATKAKRAAARKQGIKSGSDALASAPGASPASAIKSLTGLNIGAKKAQAAPPVDDFRSIPKAKGPFKSGAGAEVDDFRAMPKTPPKPAAKAKVAATAANTKDYDKTVALQKKLGVTADGIMGPKTRAAMKAAGMATSTPGSKVKQPGPSVTQNPAYNQTGMDDGDMPNAKPKIRTDMPGGPSRLNAFKLVYNKATPAQKKAMIARLRQAQAKRNAPPKPKKKPRTLGKQNSKMPKSFGGFGPRVDDPKGGETVNLPFGMSYKTLPEKDRDSAFGDN